MKTFQGKNDSVAGTEALLREMGAFFHREKRAEELCAQMDRQMADAAAEVKKYGKAPRVAIIHFGRASNVYLLVGNGGGGDASTAGKMVELAGGQMAIQQAGMQRMASPELIAKSNPDVILITEYGFDRLGSFEKANTLPGVAETDAARHNRIFRVSEHELMYFGRIREESHRVGEAHPSMNAGPQLRRVQMNAGHPIGKPRPMQPRSDRWYLLVLFLIMIATSVASIHYGAMEFSFHDMAAAAWSKSPGASTSRFFSE